MNEKKKFSIKQGQEGNSIYNHSSYGPIFGSSPHNLKIGNLSHSNSANNEFHIGSCYGDSNTTANQNSIRMFCGQ
jgi:hypothetical protein